MPLSSSTGRDSEKFNLRLPDGMRERIAQAAKANNRSMNSEIVARLEASFSEGGIDELARELIDALRSGRLKVAKAP